MTDEANRLAALLSVAPLAVAGASPGVTVHPLTLSGAAPEGRGGVEGPAGASTPGSLREPSAQHERGAERLPPGYGSPAGPEAGAEAPGPDVPAVALQLPPGATLAAAVEAVLLVANEPMSVRDLMRILFGAMRAEVNAALRELKARYAERPTGFDLLEVAGGVRLLTRPEYSPWVERVEKVRREERLSRAQLEVLAVVAYRQPLLRADLDSVRGADSGGALRGLVEKGLVKVAGRADALGRPLLYGTTDKFLERFALKSLRDLPRPKADA